MSKAVSEFYDLSSGGEEDPEVVISRLSHSLHGQVSFGSDQEYFSDDDFRFSTTPLAPPTTGVGIVTEGDDGWMSDTEECAPVVCTVSQGINARKPYMEYEDEVWVDEAKGTFNMYKTSDLAKISELLREMFVAHGDTYTLLLAFLNRTGRARMQKKSLPRILLSEFQSWLKETTDKNGSQQKNAVLTSKHRQEALQVLTSCHAVLMDDLTAVFDLSSAGKNAQLDLIDTLLTQDRLKEAVTYTWKFRLQQHFEMDMMLLPLVALDKINMIENYINESRHLQEQFVSLLDDLCEPGTTQAKINSFLANCTLGPKSLDRNGLSKSNCKLNFKQLYRLAHRMVTKYSLDLSQFPHIHSRKSSGSLHHLLVMRYVEGSITEQNIDDLLENVVEDNQALQFHLVSELLHFNDLPAAVKWAVKCDLLLDHLPLAVQLCFKDKSSNPYLQANIPTSHSSNSTSHASNRFYELPLPISSVIFVDKWAELEKCWKAISKLDVVIGIDAEWKLPSCNKGIERLAILQLAVDEAVYLLDMVGLPKIVEENTLRQFMTSLLQSNHSIKLGYGIGCDLHMLTKSWPFVRDLVSEPKRIIDLRRMEKMVDNLSRNGAMTFVPSLPPHPLLKGQEQVTCKSHDSKLPEHPLLLQYRTQDKIKATQPVTLPDPYGVAVRRGGLSSLVDTCFGKPLDKSQQLSDWEKRPLTPKQVKYAALDAHCLLGVYRLLKSRALTFDPSFDVEPVIAPTPSE